MRHALRYLAIGAMAVAFPMLHSSPVQACGDSEAPISCGDTGTADDARWMLKRVVAEVKAHEDRALTEFTRGENGFRTVDLYVFCMGQDGRLDAHPDPGLMGRDARQLQDDTGKHFAAEMMDQAEEGKITEVSYLFPKPGSNVPVPKTSFVTRVRDQVCGVGYYP